MTKRHMTFVKYVEKAVIDFRVSAEDVKTANDIYNKIKPHIQHNSRDVALASLYITCSMRGVYLPLHDWYGYAFYETIFRRSIREIRPLIEAFDKPKFDGNNFDRIGVQLKMRDVTVEKCKYLAPYIIGKTGSRLASEVGAVVYMASYVCHDCRSMQEIAILLSTSEISIRAARRKANLILKKVNIIKRPIGGGRS